MVALGAVHEAGAPPAVGRRAHRMPFGAEVRADGSTRFRLWAPGAVRVELWLEEAGRALPMPRDAGGWAECITREAPAGTRYRYRVDSQALVPDPAARFQPGDVHGPSEVIDPLAYAWADTAWRGLPPERLVFYELHVGAFTAAGTYHGVAERLDHLASLGVTAIELMPLADFPGRWGWGYDGVLLFAPESRYGRPEELKALVDGAHARGLAVLLDVVYNHFGPEGNYLHRYAPAFFETARRTPWGSGINYDGAGSEIVRAFAIHNALYWLEEFHVDGLRLDAVNAIVDDSDLHLLVELGRAVAAGPGRDRRIHLVLENGANEARYLKRETGPLYQAQWNDDVHHALHVALTGEAGGYYGDYQPPLPHLGRALVEGFSFQGERSGYRARARGEPSAGLPPTAFVGYLQNHDQVGNRARGERITTLCPPEAVRAATAVLLLSPAPPLLFMGQEWGAPEPFLFFSDLGPGFGSAVAAGRVREFARFPEFATVAARGEVPDPQAATTRERSVLDWSLKDGDGHREWLALHRALLALRAEAIVPLLAGEPVPVSTWKPVGPAALEVTWDFPAGTLRLVANLSGEAVEHAGPGTDWGRRVHAVALPASRWSALPPWSVAVYLAGARP